jgi:hypothetical protein
VFLPVALLETGREHGRDIRLDHPAHTTNCAAYANPAAL